MMILTWILILFFDGELFPEDSVSPGLANENPDYAIKRGLLIGQVTTAFLNLHQAITNIDAANITSIVNERRISPVV